MNGWILFFVFMFAIASIVASVIFNATYESSKQAGDKKLFIGAVTSSVVFGLLFFYGLVSNMRSDKKSSPYERVRSSAGLSASPTGYDTLYGQTQTEPGYF